MESALTIMCQGEPLQGVLAVPPADTARSAVGVLIVVGGPQYRVGSHRQFVLLARALSGAGHSSLRFDVRGMGDTPGRPRRFEELTDDIRAGVDALTHQLPDLRGVVLFGLCDGASAALLYQHDTNDPRVVGLCLLNPWVRSEQSLARTHLKHYYRARIVDPAFWHRLSTGGVAWQRLRDFSIALVRARGVARPATPAGRLAGRGTDFRTAMAAAWRSFGGSILLFTSGDDLTAREFLDHAESSADWRRLLQLPSVQHVQLANADHTLSGTRSRLAFESAVCRWLSGMLGPTGTSQKGSP